jgi:hypothetical protein
LVPPIIITTGGVPLFIFRHLKLIRAMSNLFEKCSHEITLEWLERSNQA